MWTPLRGHRAGSGKVFRAAQPFDAIPPTALVLIGILSVQIGSALAKHLASKHPRAIAIDCDVTPGSSTRAKIEAFLELSGIEPRRSDD